MSKINKELIDRLIREADAGVPSEVSLLEALEFRRGQYGLSQRQFARVLGVTPANYSRFVNHGRGLSLQVLRRAYAIGVPASILLGRKANP
jgi:transcriptional regulator with XRE-family HTH domain